MFVHRLDPIIADLGGLYLWYYGASYSLGFLGIFLWARSNRARFGLSLAAAYDAGIFLALGVLLGARFVEVVFYEWDFFVEHPNLIPAFWLGGMATHGVLVGTAIACWAYSIRYRKPFLAATDVLVVPGAFLMALGRIGNFFDGQIVGATTEVWWGVVFPDMYGPRHPVVLYDGLKNFLLMLLLRWVRRSSPPVGTVTAHFIFWYGFLRIFIDFFRDYRVDMFGLGPGQLFNIAMSLLGLSLFLWVRRFSARPANASSGDEAFGASNRKTGLLWRRFLFAFLVLFPLVIPSDWTQDVPARYGARHPGLDYSALYPRIPERAPNP